MTCRIMKAGYRHALDAGYYNSALSGVGEYEGKLAGDSNWGDTMTVVVSTFQTQITSSIRAAQLHGEITQREGDCLVSMVRNSFPAAATAALINDGGAPDYLYAQLYFATSVWQSGDALDRKTQAMAGQKLAKYILIQEMPDHDRCWATRLLNEFYEAHAASSGETIAHLAWRTAPANCC